MRYLVGWSVFFVSAVAGCGTSAVDPEPSPFCRSGESRPCVSSSGCEGEETCAETGDEFGPCMCREAGVDAAPEAAVEPESGPADAQNEPACQGDEAKCEGLTPWVCDSGSWEEQVTCDFLCEQGRCLGECVPGTARCDGVTPQTCGASASWVSGEDCEFVCSSGVCEGECVPGASRCDGLMVQQCDVYGEWHDETACSYLCIAGGCTGDCEPGAVRCVGLTAQVCDSNGDWQDESTCPFVCSSGACVGECVPGSLSCDGAVAHECDADGVWDAGSLCPFVCASGVCMGSCVPGSLGCDGTVPKTCDGSGSWVLGSPCGGLTPSCSAGQCVAETPSPSCQGMVPGCGPQQDSDCCASAVVPGGTFNRRNDPAYPATVSDFRLDLYEITVGRFRAFLEAGGGVQTAPPATGAGAHPLIPNSGWQEAWNDELPPTLADLQTRVHYCKYAPHTNQPGPNEYRPMSCIDWYLSFAFCAWDGGRLPTTTEWEYAAAGGDEQRYFPWSSPPDSQLIEPTHASYYVNQTLECYGDGVAGCGVTDQIVVGTKPAGYARWGHAEMSGNVWEWVLDWYSIDLPTPCHDCAELDPVSIFRGLRGSSFISVPYYLPTAATYELQPDHHSLGAGARCAR